MEKHTETAEKVISPFWGMEKQEDGHAKAPVLFYFIAA